MKNLCLLQFIILLKLYLTTSLAVAQNTRTLDSLQKVLQTNLLTRQKVDVYNLMAKEYRYADSAKVAQYTQQAISLANQINYLQGIADARYYLGWINLMTGHYPTALELFELTRQTAQKAQYQKGIALGYNGLGVTYLYQGNDPKALQMHRQALKIRQKISDQAGIAASYNNLGLIYYSQGNYPQAIQMHRQALKIRTQSGDQQGMAMSYNNIGTIYQNQGKYAQAIQMQQQSLRIEKKIGDQQGIAYSYNNLGIIYGKQGNYPKSLQMHRQGLQIKEKIGDRAGVAASYNNMGVIYENQGRFPEALQMHQKALKIREKIGDQKGVASSYSNMGIIYDSQHNYAQALKMYQKALQVDKKTGNKEGLAQDYNKIASIYLRQGNYTQARQMYEQALKMTQQLGEKSLIAENYMGLGKLALVQNQLIKGKSYFQKALQLRQALGEKAASAETWVNLGIAYYTQKNYPEARQHLKKGVTMAQKTGNTEAIRDGAKYLANVYAATQEYQKAYENQVLFKQMTDSLFNQKNTQKIAQLEAQYKFDKEKEVLQLRQVNERKLLKAEIEAKTAHNQLAYLGLTFAVLLLGTLGMFYRSKQRNNHKLSQINRHLIDQKDEIASQRDFIEHQNKELRGFQWQTQQSLKAALSIQQAILPFKEKVDTIFPEHFILNKPRSVVSGDFYWIEKISNKTLIAVVDCTGHGIPGAFMSMIGNTLLDHIIKVNKVFEPTKILQNLNQEVRRALRQDTSQNLNGMDLALCVLETNPDNHKVKVTFAGAKRPMYYLQADKQTVVEIRGVRKSIGGRQNSRDFTHQEFLLEKGTIIYLGSDGYVDQNNPERKTIGVQKFQELLLEAQAYELASQAHFFDKQLQLHMQSEEQRDDILLMGFRI